MNITVVRKLALATIVLMGGAGLFFIPYARDTAVVDYLLGYTPIYWQLVIGSVSGIAIGFVALKIIDAPFFERHKKYYARFFSGVRFTRFDLIFVSFCAGFGEELLFRGVLQAYWGVVLTALFFVAIHGYLNPFKPRLAIYGVFMTLAMVLIGWFAEKIGIMSSILAHTVIDIMLLSKMTKNHDTL